MSETTLLEFPCRFPVKAFGEKDNDFQDIVFELIKAHVPELEPGDLSHRLSSNARYIAVTAHITARSQAQLDAIYHDLSAHSAVLMAL